MISQKARRILVCGTYLNDTPNTMRHLVQRLADTDTHRVTQRWIAIGQKPVAAALKDFTARVEKTRTPKFRLLNDLLAECHDLESYDYVLLVDDDIRLPNQFVDQFVDTQERLEFGLAQPSRTLKSHNTFRIVSQQSGLLARETRFVEVGPLVSFTRAAFALVYPFSQLSPMGWGLEYVWAFVMAENGIKIGIIDALAVDHTLRPTASHYDSTAAKLHESELLAASPHLPRREAHRVITVFPLDVSDTADYSNLLVADWLGHDPRPQSILGRGRGYIRRFGAFGFCKRFLQPWLWLRRPLNR